jgi:hypothetical protein
MPPFSQPVSQSMPGFGSPSYYGTVYGVPATGLGQTITIGSTTTAPNTAAGSTPYLTNGGPYPSRGKVRIRATGLTGTFLLSSIVAVDSGGVFIQIAGPISGMASVDETIEFNTDAAIASINFNYTISNAVGTVDAEASLV